MAKLRNVLQTKFIGQPLHSMLSHFPLVLIPAAVALDIASLASTGGENLFVRSAFYALLAGVVFGVLAALFGAIDSYYELRDRGPATITSYVHASGMALALLISTISLGLRVGSLGAAETAVAPFVLAIVASVLAIAMSWFGARLVYIYGVRVEPAPDTVTRSTSHHKEELPDNVHRFPLSKLHIRRRQ